MSYNLAARIFGLWRLRIKYIPLFTLPARNLLPRQRAKRLVK